MPGRGFYWLIGVAVVGLFAIGALAYLAEHTRGLAAWFTALAGWAQAWGGLVAVAAAFAIANYQGQEERRRRQEVRASILRTVEEAVEYGHALVQTAKMRVGGPGTFSLSAFEEIYEPEAFDAVIETLKSAPIYDLGIYEVAADIIRFRLLMAKAKSALGGTVHGMKPADQRACPELFALDVSLFNLRQRIVARGRSPRDLDPVQPSPALGKALGPR